MIKHKIKIIPVDGKFIGYALLNDEVVKETRPCNDTISASRELAKLLNEDTQTPGKQVAPTKAMFAVPQTVVTTVAKNNPLPSSSPQKPVTRRCCGRG